MSCQSLYDFDGTLTSQDTTSKLIAELVKLRPWRCIGASWFLLRMCFAGTTTSKQANKNRAIGYLIHDLDDDCIDRVIESFSARVRPLYRPLVIASIDETIRDGCTALIVTASPAFAVRGCLPCQSIVVIGTEFEKEEDTYTGRLQGENCYGIEKVSRINDWARVNEQSLNVRTAWSDHISDFEMLSLSATRYWVGEEKLREEVMKRDPCANFLYAGET